MERLLLLSVARSSWALGVCTVGLPLEGSCSTVVAAAALLQLRLLLQLQVSALLPTAAACWSRCCYLLEQQGARRHSAHLQATWAPLQAWVLLLVVLLLEEEVLRVRHPQPSGERAEG